MKKFLIGMMIAGGLVSAAQAANWHSTPSAFGTQSSIDLESLIFMDQTKTIRSAWLRIPAPEFNGFELSRVFVHCSTRMIKFGLTTNYTNNGVVISSTNNAGPWTFTTPSSLGEHWANIICSTSVPNR